VMGSRKSQERRLAASELEQGGTHAPSLAQLPRSNANFVTRKPDEKPHLACGTSQSINLRRRRRR
jgi:hypothetical protein